MDKNIKSSQVNNQTGKFYTSNNSLLNNKNKTKSQIADNSNSFILKFGIMFIIFIFFFYFMNQNDDIEHALELEENNLTKKKFELDIKYQSLQIDLMIESSQSRKNSENETNLIRYVNMEEEIEKYNIYASQSKLLRLKKDNEFLNLCLLGKIINNTIYDEPFANPKISIVIPVYNGAKFLNKAITSIKNQNMKEIEIIIINDNSKDNSLEVINEYILKDKRIKVFTNKKNMGILYSRSIGVLKAKGKYIMTLDQDDLFLSENLFNNIYDYADAFNLDILEFKGYHDFSYKLKLSTDDIYFRHRSNNFTLVQPKLSEFIYRENPYEIKCNNAYLWGKLIKREVYVKALKTIGKEIYSQFVTSNEDVAVLYLIFKTARTYHYLGYYGIYHIRREDTASIKLSNSRRALNSLFLIQFMIDFTENNEKDREIIIHLVKNLCNTFKDYKTFNSQQEDIFENKKKIFNFIMNDDVISKKQKRMVKECFKDIKLETENKKY